MTTREIVIVAAAGVILVGGGAWYFWPAAKAPVTARVPGTPAPAAGAVALATTNAPASTNAAALPRLSPVDRNWLDSHWASWVRAPLRDPFLLLPPPAPKLSAPVTPVSQLQLNGLWVQTGNRIAVINQTVFGEGDTVAGFRILRIEPDKVVVQGPERTENVTFNTFVPGSTNSAARGTNWVETFLGPEKEDLRY